MKIMNFRDDTTRHINCYSKIQLVSKSHEKVSLSKTNFLQIQTLWAGAYKNRVDAKGIATTVNENTLNAFY